MRGRIRAWAFFMADLSSEIETAASQPAKATADGVSVEQRSLSDLIAADKYLKAQTAATKNHFGLRISKLEPGGTG
jgi:hypothetical protein